MAKPFVLLLFGTIALLLLCEHQVLAGVRNHIEPIVSNVYYLQDYCNLPENSLEEKYRHRRSSKSSEESVEEDHDHDHDHDHDNIDGLDIAEDIHNTVKYYARKGYRKIKEQIKREREFQKKWKQVFLDPISQPSIVVRLWRPHDEYYQEHHRILEKVALNQQIRCNILLRMSANSSDNSLGALANSTLGAVVNFLKLNKKPWLNNYRLRIVTSDPNMTQYWLHGRKLTSAGSSASSTQTSTSSSSSSSSSASSNGSTSRPLPVAVDLLTNPKMYPEPLQRDELEQISTDQSKWLLIELETLNEAATSSDTATVKSDTATAKSDTTSSNSDNGQAHDDTELVINLYAQSTKTLSTTTSSGQSGEADNQTSKNGTVSITYQCPIGTFDCVGDGSQCIPSGLRCNGEDNCGNRFDELFNCGTVNLYYIFGSDSHQAQEYLSSDGFWFAVRILILLFLIVLVLYTMSLLCRCCCDRRGRGYLINGKSPMVYVRSAKSGLTGTEPLLASSSSSSSGGYGPTAGRAMKSSNFQFAPSGPPPSYFGNQSDNQKSNVNEYIYVNNNYGQPQGSTTVNTSVRPSRDNINSGPTAPPQYPDDFPPMYPNIEYPNYGGTNKC